MTSAQMAKNRWLRKCLILLHMLKPLHLNALKAIVSSSNLCCEKNPKRTGNDVKRGSKKLQNFIKSRPVKLRIFSAFGIKRETGV
jgi:hypothetical protein